MVFTLIIPEFLVAKAFAERTVARKSMDEVKILKEVDGGSLSEAEISNWTTAHAFYAEMGGFFIRPYGEGTTDTIVVAAADILALRRKGLLRTLPKITAEHLNDLSNGDMFTKAVAIGQVCWMVVQVVVRAAKGLPITQLEITTCGFAASTFLIYLLWWEKPQAVRSATELPLSTESPEFELLDSFEVRVFGFYELVATIGPNRGLRINESMPNETIADVVGERFFVGCLLGGIMLGGVECAAWYFHFPTNIELWLWRISSLVTVAASPVVCIAFMLEAYFAEILRIPKSDKVPIVVNYIAVALFFVARLFILFETMCSFFHLPPGAFVSTWSSSIPHIA
jgi:hypothetical protein